MNPEGEKLIQMAETFKTLGHTSRLSILMVLTKHRQMCVSNLQILLQIEQSALSHNLIKMREVGLLKVRREGQKSYYSLADKNLIVDLISLLNR